MFSFNVTAATADNTTNTTITIPNGVVVCGFDPANGTIECAKIVTVPEVVRRRKPPVWSPVTTANVGMCLKAFFRHWPVAIMVQREQALRRMAKNPLEAAEYFTGRAADAANRRAVAAYRAASRLAYAKWLAKMQGEPTGYGPRPLTPCRIAAFDTPALPKGGKETPLFDMWRHDRHGNVPEIPRQIAAADETDNAVERTAWRIVEDRHGRERYRFPVARFEPATPGAVLQDGNWVSTTPAWPEVAAWAAIVATPEGADFCAERRAEYRLQLQRVFPVKGRVPYRVTPDAGAAAFDALTRAGQGETPCPVAIAAIDAARKVGAGIETDADIAARAAREVEGLAFPETRRPSPFRPADWAHARRNGRRGMRRPKWAPTPRQTGVVADPPLAPTVDRPAARRVKARRLAIEAKGAAKLARAAMAEAEARLAFAKSLSGPGSRVHRAAKLAASAEARDAIGKAEALKARAAKLARAARAAIAEAKSDE